MSSTQEQLERIRKPRVHIKYEVETEGGAVEKELPFVVGVLGDYSGNNSSKKPSLKNRKFTNIDRDNFDDVLAKQEPGVKMRVKNTLTDDDTEMNVELKFNKMEDFEPDNIVNQVPELAELKAARDKLRDLFSKSERSEELENILESTLQDSDLLKKLADELGVKQ